jgi:hypothetical protein
MNWFGNLTKLIYCFVLKYFKLFLTQTLSIKIFKSYQTLVLLTVITFFNLKIFFRYFLSFFRSTSNVRFLHPSVSVASRSRVAKMWKRKTKKFVKSWQVQFADPECNKTKKRKCVFFRIIYCCYNVFVVTLAVIVVVFIVVVVVVAVGGVVAR